MLIIPEKNVSVIDIGCGLGHYCFSLAQKGKKEILGIDFSETIIALTNDHFLFNNNFLKNNFYES